MNGVGGADGTSVKQEALNRVNVCVGGGAYLNEKKRRRKCEKRVNVLIPEQESKE